MFFCFSLLLFFFFFFFFQAEDGIRDWSVTGVQTCALPISGGRPLSLWGYCESVGEQPAKIRILVLDEQPLHRHGISAYLNSQPDMMVCGEGGSVSDARSKVAECQPQFVVTALRLGAGDNLKLIKERKSQKP